MNAEQLHDALGMLPSDLITETDKLRSKPRKTVIHWRKIVAVAACAVLVLGCGLLVGRFLPAKSGTAQESALEKDSLMSEAPAVMCGPAAAGAAGNDSKNVLTDNAPADAVAEECGAITDSQRTAAAEFAVDLFQNTAKEGENTLLSPFSVLSALAMTANGADGQTLAQMEDVLGMTADDLNAYFRSYGNAQGENLKPANAIWFNSSASLQVAQDFLDTNEVFFGADLYEAPMNPETCQAINSWVDEKTDGAIPKILDAVPEDAMLYLVNALAFEAEWPEAYRETSVQEATFTREDGTEQTVELMYAKESRYIEDEFATGFIKPYKGGDYAFVALLPKDGVSVSEYVASLSGEALQEMLRNPTDAVVYTAIPKFTAEYDADMAEILKTMGMTDAFDAEKADFSRMGTCENGNLYISRVLHKTSLTVAEQGTKAGAATVVEMLAGAAFIPEPKEVTLNRPFVYMLIDCEQNLPLFIGTMMDMES